MAVFEVIIGFLVAGAALSVLARRWGAPYPALVALAGAVLAGVSEVPSLQLDPELLLTLFIAPVLVDAAFDASPRDLKTNWKPVTSLAVGAVLMTILGVMGVAHALVPGMPWSAALALGAIVAPPDAAAASAVLKQLKPPHRLLVILEGESLFNDAGALLVYRYAVVAALGAAVTGWEVGRSLLVVGVGSVALALAVAHLAMALFRRLDDVPTAVVCQFGTSIGVWMLAERLHLSGIITTVVFAMVASRKTSDFLPARIRVASWAFWEVAVFVLNVLAFILVGFQLRHVKLGTYTGVVAAVCLTVVLVRILYVAGWLYFRPCRTKEAVVIAWCGMRGTVTLAVALALPASFPYRDLLLASAFGVTLVTLVVQGLTLRPLMLKLQLKDDGAVEEEVRRARLATLEAACEAIGKGDDFVHRAYAQQLQRAREADGVAPVDARAVRAALEAQRECLLGLRDAGTIGDAARQRLEEEFDRLQLGWAELVDPEDRRVLE